MIACASCGFEAPDDFAFCPKCGGALATALPSPEERKVVTTLFCDLVGFTAMSEGADPEDVDAVLGAYHKAARRVIDSHGGTVEKFIGDAVVGVFGVPAAHEDDAERAVRAGLRILEALEGMTRPDGNPLEARCGVNTGEALVRLDVDPASGRGFLTGDAVNVAARLQSAAPPMGVVVGQATQGLTERAIIYEPIPPVSAKGKPQPVPAWLATGTLALRGIEARGAGLTPLVGREVELAYLSAIFDNVTSQSAAQVALIVGEPGIGKSRLVGELSVLVDARPQMTTWRQGYCPPFGEDITYGALAEIVKRHAGIRDNDPAHSVEAKLETVLPDGPDRQWLRQRLRALLGLKAPEGSRDENFAAWTRFFEEVAGAEPTVLVFEDLHWADEALLAFLEYLVSHVASVPLLIVETTRPELFERHPDFASGGGVNRVDLDPLSPGETARLVAGLLGEPDDRAEAVNHVVERCDGNPFYAEQSARLLADTSPEASLPDSVQAVIAARLDMLPADQKALLGDAAVVGSVFWGGVLEVLGEREPHGLEDALSALLERQMIRRIRESSMEGEQEFAFAHALARDVVYQQLPRAARARKHQAVAEWLEGRVDERAVDLAELLAYHYLTALELAEATKDQDLRDSLIRPLLRNLELAGHRAMVLDVAAAERHFARAVGLLDPGDVDRARFLAQWAMALSDAGRTEEAVPALETATLQLLAAGDRRRAAKALFWLGTCQIDMGLPDGWPNCSEAVELLDGDEPSSERVFICSNASLFEADAGQPQRALQLAELAVEDAAELGLTACSSDAEGCSLYLCALMARGWARCHLGDIEGLADMDEASEASRSQGAHPLPVMNYAVAVNGAKGPLAALPIYARGLDLLSVRGQERLAVRNLANVLAAKCEAGFWQEVLSESDGVVGRLEAAQDVMALAYLKAVIGLLLACRGESDVARPLVAWSLEIARESGERDLLADALVSASAVLAGTDPQAALSHLKQLPDVVNSGFLFNGAEFFPHMLRGAHRLGEVELAKRLTVWIDLDLPMHASARTYGAALLAEALGERESAAAGFAVAAKRWHDFGVPYEEAQALLGQGRCTVALGRVPEAAAPLAAAREIFARLGARPALAEAEELLARTHPA